MTVTPSMGVLRVYDPPDCDEHGVPLGWECCRTCEGSGMVALIKAGQPMVLSLTADGMVVEPTCPTCDGHGSLKAAALHHVVSLRNVYHDGASARCEVCGHQMSDGAWEPGLSEGQAEAGTSAMVGYAFIHLRGGGSMGSPHEPPGPVHYSPCDDGCRHGGPGRWGGRPAQWAYADLAAPPEGEVEGTVLQDRIAAGFPVEASWRPVDVRTLGWPHDLRPERLAVLCLRCWAAR